MGEIRRRKGWLGRLTIMTRARSRSFHGGGVGGLEVCTLSQRKQATMPLVVASPPPLAPPFARRAFPMDCRFLLLLPPATCSCLLAPGSCLVPRASCLLPSGSCLVAYLYWCLDSPWLLPRCLDAPFLCLGALQAPFRHKMKGNRWDWTPVLAVLAHFRGFDAQP